MSNETPDKKPEKLLTAEDLMRGDMNPADYFAEDHVSLEAKNMTPETRPDLTINRGMRVDDPFLEVIDPFKDEPAKKEVTVPERDSMRVFDPMHDYDALDRDLDDVGPGGRFDAASSPLIADQDGSSRREYYHDARMDIFQREIDQTTDPYRREQLETVRDIYVSDNTLESLKNTTITNLSITQEEHSSRISEVENQRRELIERVRGWQSEGINVEGVRGLPGLSRDIELSKHREFGEDLVNGVRKYRETQEISRDRGVQRDNSQGPERSDR